MRVPHTLHGAVLHYKECCPGDIDKSGPDCVSYDIISSDIAIIIADKGGKHI